MRYVILVVFVLLAFTKECFAARSLAVFLEVRNCEEASAEMRAQFGAEWQAWGKYVHVCRVSSSEGKHALSVVAVRDDLLMEDTFATDGPYGKRPEPWPETILIDLHGRRIGALASPVIGDFPGDNHVVFRDWRDGFPYRIEVLHTNAAASGTYWEEPLIWNKRAGRYETKK
jgi:hypothetical protein